MRSNAAVQTDADYPERRTNRLSSEKSPYLLQHQYNPVSWQPWGAEAFAEARRENRPIFLSVGYSTCHWCHVMERESFEDERIAAFLNQHFVSIKVDREERPDVDRIYMTFVQATTGQGGWPLNLFLTPSLKPFFGGTYFPPADLPGRPGFLHLLEQIHKLWDQRQADLTGSAEEMHSRLRQAVAALAPQAGGLTPDVLKHAGELIKSTYDPRHGGFGAAPKFPQPSYPEILLRCARRFDDREALSMVLHTCERMAAGGIHDQLGGGFARYSVDAEWQVPHFEKMLYDNAQLADLYLDAFLISGQEKFAATVRDILDYVLRDMTHPEGGFYSAEDADSEGHEGKFYCWTADELKGLLTGQEFSVAARYFGITEKGNFLDHSHPHPLPNQNVLSIADPTVDASERALLDSARKKMFAARSRRVRPQLDDKVLASWNGLMLGAMARASAVFGDLRYRAAAMRNFLFLKANLWDERTQRLHHRWRDGERDEVQLLEAYAFLLQGVLQLYETRLEPVCLEFAIRLAERMLDGFYDAAQGGFWQTLPEAHDLVLRLKSDYDGAEPSGNSVAALALLKLGKITGKKEFTDAAEGTLRFFSQRLQQVPQALTSMLRALDFSLEEPIRVVIAGNILAGATLQLLEAAHAVYVPNRIVLSNSGPVEEFARTLMEKDRPVAYLCTGSACQAPADNPEGLREQLLQSTHQSA